MMVVGIECDGRSIVSTILIIEVLLLSVLRGCAFVNLQYFRGRFVHKNKLFNGESDYFNHFGANEIGPTGGDPGSGFQVTAAKRTPVTGNLRNWWKSVEETVDPERWQRQRE
ncbi:hypothetical protein V6N12_030552 [Hibiscus sabdariffa]|uniref:Uncharacterized protein n=1 Tax=Hibiscus sabdariffa TaxID=183260 RepID=A0ABR2BBG9_9ROSI